jgi:hypothetical protein
MFQDPMDIMDEFDEMFRRLHAEFRQGFSINPLFLGRVNAEFAKKGGLRPTCFMYTPCALDRDECSTCVRINWSGSRGGLVNEADGCDDNGRSTPCGDSACSSIQNPWEEPVTEIQHGNEGLTATTSLPGVTEENVSIAVRNGRIVIDAVCSDRHYREEIPIPERVDAGTIRHTIRNGVLEIVCGAASK